jgi:hypothetical protein
MIRMGPKSPNNSYRQILKRPSLPRLPMYKTKDHIKFSSGAHSADQRAANRQATYFKDQFENLHVIM